MLRSAWESAKRVACTKNDNANAPTTEQQCREVGQVQSTACTQGDGFGVQNQVLNGLKRNASEHPHYLWASDEVFLIASGKFTT